MEMEYSETMVETRHSRKAVVPAFIGLLAVAAGLYFLLRWVADLSAEHTLLYDFGTLMGGCAEGSISYRILWFLTDITEGTFVGSLPASILVVVGSFIGAYLERRKSPHAGSGVDGNGAIFTVLACSGFASLILGQLVYGFWFDDGFLPTFAAFLSVQAMLLAFQAKRVSQAATVVVLGTLLNVPLCFFFIQYFTSPNYLPLFCAVGLSIIITVPVCSEIMHRLPWMKEAPTEEAASEDVAEEEATANEETLPVHGETHFFIHRVFADVTEQILWGSSIGGMLMYVGAILGVILNPAHAGFNMVAVIPMQILTAALAVFVWYPKWKKDGWAFTFPALLFVSAVTITYPNTPQILIPTVLIAVFGILPLLGWLLKVTKYNGRWAVIVFVLISVCSLCIPWGFFVGHVLA